MNVGDLVSWSYEDWVGEWPNPPRKVTRIQHARVVTPGEDLVAVVIEGSKIVFKKRSEIICLGPSTW